ncbi:protein atonal homolog 8 [Xiphophorus maculatus]|uniref:protein atonal homolog 8 n=1 Tax=Xiphophorus maculatus TaxID=8083 RepID=UPI000C6EA603|nr:protein atonal homolog 8 [Xiphophorus maculatus]
MAGGGTCLEYLTREASKRQMPEQPQLAPLDDAPEGVELVQCSTTRMKTTPLFLNLRSLPPRSFLTTSVPSSPEIRESDPESPGSVSSMEGMIEEIEEVFELSNISGGSSPPGLIWWTLCAFNSWIHNESRSGWTDALRTSLNQPLNNRLKLGLHSTVPVPAPTSGTISPSHQAFCWESSLPGQPETAPRVSQCFDHVKTQVSEQKESPRKKVGVDGDTRARLPEVKAIQQTRRLLANARERTRVHTISAAFEALRKQVPCYSYGQKLSKLAILRIACNYILSLAHLAELDYSPDHSSVSFSQCVEQCTRTLQAEGRSKKRKE